MITKYNNLRGLRWVAKTIKDHEDRGGGEQVLKDAITSGHFIFFAAPLHQRRAQTPLEADLSSPK